MFFVATCSRCLDGVQNPQRAPQGSTVEELPKGEVSHLRGNEVVGALETTEWSQKEIWKKDVKRNIWLKIKKTH